jgi:pantetheine-phosphate adenylyltransferase
MKYLGIKDGEIVKGDFSGDETIHGGSEHLIKKGITPLIVEKDNHIHVEQRKPKKAVYAGSFDPLTCGHLWVIRYGLSLFDDLIIAVADNPDKKYTFSLKDRLAMLNKSVQPLVGWDEATHFCKNGSIKWLGSSLETCHIGNKFLVDFAAKKKAQFILRGLRNIEDFSFELEMAHFNSDLNTGNVLISTVLAPCPKSMVGLSSSFVKGLCGPDYWEDRVQQMVPPVVFNKLKEWVKNKKK